MGVGGQRHAPAALPPGKIHGTHFIGVWVGLRAGLDWCGKSRPTGIRSPDRPVRRQSLCRLRYPAHLCEVETEVLSIQFRQTSVFKQLNSPVFLSLLCEKCILHSAVVWLRVRAEHQLSSWAQNKVRKLYGIPKETLMRIRVFWDVTRYQLVKSYRRFDGAYCFYSQGTNILLPTLHPKRW